MVVEPAYRLAASLLRHPNPKTLREAFPDAGMTPNQAYPISRWLEFHGAVTKRGDHYEADLKTLVDLLSAQRRRHVLPAATHLVAPPIEDVHAQLDAAGIRHVFAYTTAANLLVYFEPLPHIEVYVEKRDVARVRPSLRPGKVPLEVYTTRLDDLPHDEGDRGLPRTDLLRTAVDVNAHPYGGAHAALLRDALSEAYK